MFLVESSLFYKLRTLCFQYICTSLIEYLISCWFLCYNCSTSTVGNSPGSLFAVPWESHRTPPAVSPYSSCMLDLLFIFIQTITTAVYFTIDSRPNFSILFLWRHDPYRIIQIFSEILMLTYIVFCPSCLWSMWKTLFVKCHDFKIFMNIC